MIDCFICRCSYRQRIRPAYSTQIQFQPELSENDSQPGKGKINMDTNFIYYG